VTHTHILEYNVSVMHTIRHVVMICHSGGALVSINEVNLRRARLVLGWGTVSGFNSRCGTFISVCNQPRGQLRLVIFFG